MVTYCPGAMRAARAYIRIGVKRNKCTNLYAFRGVYGLCARCCSCLPPVTHRPNREGCRFSSRHLERARIIACCYTTRTPANAWILFIAAATSTCRKRSRSSIISCAITHRRSAPFRSAPLRYSFRSHGVGRPSWRRDRHRLRLPHTVDERISSRPHTGVAKNSLHIQAEAIDLRMPGIEHAQAAQGGARPAPRRRGLLSSLGFHPR